MHVIQEVDPHFQRTIVVSSKFDNRMKEFGERWEVDRYLSAAGYLHQNVQPFFVALPKVDFPLDGATSSTVIDCKTITVMMPMPRQALLLAVSRRMGPFGYSVILQNNTQS